MRPPRVAYFPDSFHEINGVAHTSRNFVAYAERHALPFLCVRAGSTLTHGHSADSVEFLELPRSFAAVGVEKDLAFDPLFFRHIEAIDDALHRFKPDLIHLTGPSELGIFAAYFAHKLKIPLAASWHTNVHEYAARRLPQLSENAARHVEHSTLAVTTRFYRLAKVLFAPNLDLCEMLSQRTGKPCHLMQRGVNTTLFSPHHRARSLDARPFSLGFVGRLSLEKNVALLPKIQQDLTRAGLDVRFVIIGQGSEETALRAALPAADFPGVLRGEVLARAYANMDLFVFPSHTDTFGNVVLEALASGVPAIVTPNGGPRTIVKHGHTGLIATGDEFASSIASILRDSTRLIAMRAAAREYALSCTWDAVFDRVYAAYESILPDR
jgi:phosphatidylinositol alpha 1,6-mannosyltransferase